MPWDRRCVCLGVVLAACASGDDSPPAELGSTRAASSVVASAAMPLARPGCRKLTAEDFCVVGPLQRPSRGKDRDGVLSQVGSQIFSYGRAEDFDPETVRWATATGCPLWRDVFVTDRTDVHVLEPMSCGGNSCGGDYTGYGWGRLYVRHTASFKWLAGGYGADQRHVYNRWAAGPLDHARPSHFEVLLCGGEDGFVVGHDDGGGIYDDRPAEPTWYRDGKRVDEASAFTP